MILVIMMICMTKPHSSVDNSYSFSRSISLLLMDMSGIFLMMHSSSDLYYYYILFGTEAMFSKDLSIETCNNV